MMLCHLFFHDAISEPPRLSVDHPNQVDQGSAQTQRAMPSFCRFASPIAFLFSCPLFALFCFLSSLLLIACDRACNSAVPDVWARPSVCSVAYRSSPATHGRLLRCRRALTGR